MMKENIIIKREIQKMHELYNTSLSSDATTGKVDSAKIYFEKNWNYLGSDQISMMELLSENSSAFSQESFMIDVWKGS